MEQAIENNLELFHIDKRCNIKNYAQLSNFFLSWYVKPHLRVELAQLGAGHRQRRREACAYTAQNNVAAAFFTRLRCDGCVA